MGQLNPAELITAAVVSILGAAYLIAWGTRAFTRRNFSERAAERDLIIQKAYLEQLFEAAQEAIVIVDTKNIIQKSNREFTNLFGYLPAEVIGRNLDDLIVPPDKAEEGKWLDVQAERGVNMNMETIRQSKDGTRIEVSLMVTPVNVSEGQIAVYCIYRDITPRKRAEEELRESEDRYRRLVELSPDAIWIQRDGGRIDFINSAGVKLLGASSPEEVLGQTIFDFIDASFHDDVMARMAQLVEAGQSVPFLERRLIRMDGTEVDVEVAATSFKYDQHAASQVIVHDLTERKRAESQLRAAETRFRRLVEQLPAVTYMAGFGPNGRWTYVSPQVEAILGFTPEEWISDPGLWYARLHPDDATKAIEHEAECHATGEPYAAEYRLRAKDGTYHWFSDLGTMVRGTGGAPDSMQGVLMEITEQKQLEAQLRQSSKMEAVGRLAGGIAHDFNNILMVVRGHTELVLDGAAQKPRDNIAQIQKAVDRASTLTRQLLAFSRMQVLQPDILDLNDLVADVAQMILRLIGSNIRLVIETNASLGKVRADAGQIELVMLNLAVNARDAMPKGGSLTLRTENVALKPGDNPQFPNTAQGNFVVLSVEDTGQGMTIETQAHIFEPFFTTKESGRGTGLGLATVYGIVKQSGGYISVDSTPGAGTTFRIYLPYVDAPSKKAATLDSLSVPHAPAKGSETILVVDDESGIRELATNYLERCGYNVLAAGDGAEAREISEKHAGPIHLLLTDTVMPRMSGHDLVRAMADRHPETKVIYMSGYLEFHASSHLKQNDGATYLQKPFALDTLAQKIRSALDSN
jgi:two-component system, cell cycle sensor histidine kinase and response regulator CckA